MCGLHVHALDAFPISQGPWNVAAQSESPLDGSVRSVNMGLWLIAQLLVQIASFQHE